ncbi:MAG: dimethylsulfoniopropionate demethylase [Rhodobacteraceae bacterium]|nr:dimethylsulfoniopropionate demethylase [Paracoccaceae bacterium]
MQGVNLHPSIRVRKTPFWDRVVESGVQSCSVYNHMLLPVMFESYESDYYHLKEHVQIWDVSCERQVEIRGPDAFKLIEILTPRPIHSLTPGQCAYLPVVDQFGGMLNDPVLVVLAEDRYWLSLSDSDYLYWVLAIAAMKKFNVDVFEPDVSPLGVQGPKADNLMVKVFGEKLQQLKFFQFLTVEFNHRTHIVSRSGYSKQGGFEIYVEGTQNGIPLWDVLMDAGIEFNVRAGSPNTPERIEGGLLSYGSDITRNDNPYECGLGHYCDVAQTPNCIGYGALMQILEEGWSREIRYLEIKGSKVPPCHTPWPIKVGNQDAGKVTSAAWSPEFNINVAIAMVEKEFWDAGTEVEVVAPDQARSAIINEKSFV